MKHLLGAQPLPGPGDAVFQAASGTLVSGTVILDISFWELPSLEFLR